MVWDAMRGPDPHEQLEYLEPDTGSHTSLWPLIGREVVVPLDSPDLVGRLLPARFLLEAGDVFEDFGKRGGGGALGPRAHVGRAVPCCQQREGHEDVGGRQVVAAQVPVALQVRLEQGKVTHHVGVDEEVDDLVRDGARNGP